MKRVQRLGFIFCGALLGWYGCDTPKDAVQQETLETVVQGIAPLNTNGIVHIYQANTHQELAKAAIDAMGHFSIKLGVAQGDLLLEATGGNFQELASGNKVDTDGSSLRAMAPDVTVATHPYVVISPWTELAVAAVEASDNKAYPQIIQQLTALLTCQQPDLATVLTTEPIVPTEAQPVESISPATLAYIYQGAWSQLAVDLSLEAGMQPGSRITSMRLAQVLSRDMAAGRISGTAAGKRLELVSNVFLPADILRQRLAQAARHFIDAPANVTKVRSSAMLDLLQCISANDNNLFGPAGESLDTAGPTLALSYPPTNVVIAGEQEVVCEASDASFLSSLRLDAKRDGSSVASLLWEEPHTDIQKAKGTVRAQMNTNALNDGSLEISCTAQDHWGNQNSLVVPISVNNHGGKATVSIPASSETNGVVRGTVEITCSCEDPHLQQCVLSRSTAGMATLASQSPTTSVYLWNTTKLPDGPHNVVCEDWSQGHDKPLVASETVEIDNVIPGSLSGQVALDNPVHNIQVTAYAYADGIRGETLGTAESANGNFLLKMADYYRGPVLLDAVSSSNVAATYKSAVIDDSMPLNNVHLTLLLDDYKPGAHEAHLSVNFLSSVAETYTVALFQNKVQAKMLGIHSFADASEKSHTLWGEYLRPTERIDIRHTKVQSFEPEAKQLLAENILVGLFHVGIAQLASEYSKQGYSTFKNLTPTTMLASVREDLRDSLLDGLKDGSPIFLTGIHQMSSELLRYELAHAIRRWLNSHPQAMYGNGLHDITARSLGQPGQLLSVLAANNSVIFGEHDGRKFDEDGPALSVQFEDQYRYVRQPEQPMRQNIYITVDAKDDSGVEGIMAILDGRPIPAKQSRESGYTGHAEFILATAGKIPDGPVSLTVSAADSLGNKSEKVFNLHIHNTPPVITLPQEHYDVGKKAQVRLQGQISSAIASFVSISGGDTKVEFIMPPEGKFDVMYSVVPNQKSPIYISAFDAAGNEAIIKKIEVACHTREPAMSLEPSLFLQQWNGADAHYESDGHLTITCKDPLPKDALINLQDWGSETRTFEIYANQLDYVPDTAWGDKRQNIPIIRFRVHDKEEVGSTDMARFKAEDLTVRYAYKLRSPKTTIQGDWRSLEPDSEGVYKLPLAYQTLLPQQLQNDIMHGTKANFLAATTLDDRHEVTIEVTDPVGNRLLRTFKFKLEIWWPPVSLRQCDFHHDLRFLEKVRGRMNAPFLAQSYPLSTAKLYWTVERAPRSLLGQIDVPVNIIPGKAEISADFEYSRRYLNKSDAESRAYSMSCFRKVNGHLKSSWQYDNGTKGDYRTSHDAMPHSYSFPKLYNASPAMQLSADTSIGSGFLQRSGKTSFILSGARNVYDLTFLMQNTHQFFAEERQNPPPIEELRGKQKMILTRLQGEQKDWCEHDEGPRNFMGTHRIELSRSIDMLHFSHTGVLISTPAAPQRRIPVDVDLSCYGTREFSF